MSDQALIKNVIFSVTSCNVQGSIICTNAHIKKNVSLKDCQVGDSHTISEGGLYFVTCLLLNMTLPGRHMCSVLLSGFIYGILN